MGETLEHHMRGDYTWKDLYARYHLSDAIEFCADNKINIYEWRGRLNGNVMGLCSSNTDLRDYHFVITVDFIYCYEIEGTRPDLPMFIFSNTPENMNDIKKAIQLQVV